jgi:uncharacterized protein YjbI with pentapeptide repeats
LEADFCDIQFDGIDLNSLTIVSSIIAGVQFNESNDLYGTYWVDDKIENCTFEKMNVSKAEMLNCSFNQCVFKRIAFFRADLSNTVFYRCTFIGCDFTNTWLYKAAFNDCAFEGVKFEGGEITCEHRNLGFSDKGELLA